jgi:hypothetical protein
MKRTRSNSDDSLIRLNVGGTMLMTTKNTLVNNDFFPNSLLAMMFGSADAIRMDAEGNAFIDADVKIFRHILNVLRRPTLIEHVPDGVSPTQWCAELDYWGLAKEATPEKSLRDASSFQELGNAIKREIVENELTVVKAIFDTTGYFKQTGKTRQQTLYIPTDKYALPWGVDLGRYIEEHQTIMTQRLKATLGNCDVIVKPVTKTMKNHPYVFAGESYCSSEVATMMITIKFIDVSDSIQ